MSRITIDASSTLLRSAGVKNYTYHWIAHLRRQIAPGEEISAYPFLRSLGQLNHEAGAFSLPATALRVALLHAVNWLGPSALDVVTSGSDIFHASNLSHHAPRRTRLTATVHDLTTLLMPELHVSSNIRADRIFAERILRRADGLIAVSENTRQDAIRVLGISPERVMTIYSGIAQGYFDAAPSKRARPYALYVGSIEPRKNLETLLDAWRQLRPDLREAFELVIAGPMAWAPKATRERIRAEATYLGYVPEADLPGLIAGAAVFAYPSLYEGFGFPVVQAMAAGAPVLTSNTSCLPEITGDSALLVDPRSAAEIAAGLARLLESPTLRAELSERGKQGALRYRWETCAAQSLEFFRRIAG
ncbi:MAG TPA: glycosyltransferase family 1 protein [Bryobacteraceae bacterium]|jgi:glycosyltransferase involved in cell wall biosynthesis